MVEIKGVNLSWRDLDLKTAVKYAASYTLPYFGLAFITGTIFLCGVYAGDRITKLKQKLNEMSQPDAKKSDLVGILQNNYLKCLKDYTSVVYSSACINQSEQDNSLDGLEGRVKLETDSVQQVIDEANNVMGGKKDPEEDE